MESLKQPVIVVILRPNVFVKHIGIDACSSGRLGHVKSDDIFT